MSFLVGQKVRCVETWNESPAHANIIGCIAGEVYTIREIGNLDPSRPEWLTVRLCEIKNVAIKYYFGPYEQSFVVRRFRPLRTTDISCFKAMLVTPPKQRVRA